MCLYVCMCVRACAWLHMCMLARALLGHSKRWLMGSKWAQMQTRLSVPFHAEFSIGSICLVPNAFFIVADGSTFPISVRSRTNEQVFFEMKFSLFYAKFQICNIFTIFPNLVVFGNSGNHLLSGCQILWTVLILKLRNEFLLDVKIQIKCRSIIHDHFCLSSPETICAVLLHELENFLRPQMLYWSWMWFMLLVLSSL